MTIFDLVMLGLLLFLSVMMLVMLARVSRDSIGVLEVASHSVKAAQQEIGKIADKTIEYVSESTIRTAVETAQSDSYQHGLTQGRIDGYTVGYADAADFVEHLVGDHYDRIEKELTGLHGVPESAMGDLFGPLLDEIQDLCHESGSKRADVIARDGGDE